MDKKKRNNLYENNLSALEDSESDFNDRFIIQQIEVKKDKINELRCNTCLMIPLIIDISKKQIIYKCNCNNNNINISLANFITNFNNDKNKIKCFRCENLSKNYCFDCNYVICERHKIGHIEHKIIEINKIDCYCPEHPNEKKICICSICNKDMCSICKNSFHLHLNSSKKKEDIFTYFTDSYPLKEDIKKFNTTIEILENKLNQIEINHLKNFFNIIEIKKLFEDNKIINLNLLKILKLLSNNLTLADFPNYSNFNNYKFLFEKININFGNNLIQNKNVNQNDYKNFFNNNYILNVDDNIIKKSSTLSNSSIRDSSFLHNSIPDIEEPSALNIINININDTNEVERINLTNKNYDYSIYDYCIEKELRNNKNNLITFCIVLSNKKIALLCGTHVEILDKNFKQLDKTSGFNSVLICIEELINEKKLIVGAKNGNIIILENINNIDNSIKKIKDSQNPIIKLCRFSNDNKFASLTSDEIKIYDSFNYNCILTIKSEENEKMHSIIEHSSYLITTYNKSPIKFYYFNNNRINIVKHNLTCKSYSNNALIKLTEKEIGVGSKYKIYIVSVKDQKLINTIDLCIEDCFVTTLLKSSNKGILVGCVKIDKNNKNNKKYIIKQYDEKNNDICQLEQVHKGIIFCLCEIDEFTFVTCSIDENCAKLWKKKKLNLI
jgi:hypothetical protein